MLNSVLVIGSGGREHAIVKALRRTSHKELSINYYGTYDNPGMSKLCYPNRPYIVKDMSIKSLYKKLPNPIFEIVIIGPESALEQGFTDYFELNKIGVIGPTKQNAFIETSKIYCRELISRYIYLAKYQPKFKVCGLSTSNSEIKEYITKELNNKYVIKANKLHGGKGVKVSQEHLKNMKETLTYCNEISHEGYIIEEKLYGEEFSLITLTDGQSSIHFPPVQDFKRLNNGNTGPNTGSMGSYTLANHRLQFLSNDKLKECEKINEQIISLLRSVNGKFYKGFLYGSYMLTDKNEVKIIEYNARLGDPEAINLMELVKLDMYKLFKDVVNNDINLYKNINRNIIFENVATVCKYLVPQNYPRNPKKNFRVSFNNNLSLNNLIMGSITKKTNKFDEVYYEALGSRTCAIIVKDKSVFKAGSIVNEISKYIKGDLYSRTDIGYIFTTKTLTSATNDNVSEYEKSGVSIDEGNKVVKSIKNLVEKTYTKGVISNFGDFGGLYKLGDKILVASTDGVGTKSEHLLNILSDSEYIYNVLGQDIVNHSVNDILVKNAKPLFFLDYYASSKLHSDNVKYLVDGISKSCIKTNTAILGGETAEMPGIYNINSFDIAGTIVGETTEETMFDGKKNVGETTIIMGLNSRGPHTNGYSLIRKIYKKITDSKDKVILDKFTSQVHRCYLDEITLLNKNNVKIDALCHITGGGLIDNPERVINDKYVTYLDYNRIIKNMPMEYKLLQKYGDITDNEMLRVFNCGVGMLIYIKSEYYKVVKKLLPESYKIGYIKLK